MIKFIPWHNTRSLLNGVDGLIRMYNSLPINTPLRLFLDKNCTHLMKPLEGFTDIPTSYGKTSVLTTLTDVIKLEPTYNPELFNSLAGQVGVYVFFLDSEDKPTQCGSSIRFKGRMLTHYGDAAKNIMFYKDTHISAFKWVPIKYCDDYVKMYSVNNMMALGEEDILVSFTQQQVRSLEQAYSSYVKPLAYKGAEVNTWHSNWVSGTKFNHGTSKQVTWVTEDGTLYSRRSIASAAIELGHDRKTLRLASSTEGKTLLTNKYGTVTVSTEGFIKNTTGLDKRYNTPINTQVNLIDLKPNYYYLYDREMNPVNLGPFATVKELNNALKLPRNNSVYLWCNYLHLINITSLNLSVYVVKRSVSINVPIIATYLTENIIQVEYPSLGATAKALGLTGPTNVVSYAVTGKPYLGKNGIQYILKYKNELDYEAGKTQYIKLRNWHKQRKQYLKAQSKSPTLKVRDNLRSSSYNGNTLALHAGNAGSTPAGDKAKHIFSSVIIYV